LGGRRARGHPPTADLPPAFRQGTERPGRALNRRGAQLEARPPLKGTLICAECGSRFNYALAKGRFGYFRCIGRNNARTRCSQAAYVPASELDREVEALYEGVRVPAVLKRRLDRALHVEIAERERHPAEVAEFLSRRLRQLANERETLLRAWYADAI
jgi:hypothetical protein